MLVLTRRKNEAIVIETPQGEVVVHVLGVQGGRVKIGVEAPASMPIHRNEVTPPKRAA